MCRFQCPAPERMLEEDPRNGTRVAFPQHNSWSISQYLPYVNYYLEGTRFETSTTSRARQGGRVKTRTL